MNKEDPMLLGALGVMIGMIGGFVQYHRDRWRTGKKFSWSHMSIEIVASAVAGLIAFAICFGLDFNPWLAAAFAGIAGNAGGATLDGYRYYVKHRLKKMEIKDDRN